MPISVPSSRIGSSVRMKGLKIQRGKGGRSMLVYLNLTPMIDMFTILVVFLLMTFSATGEILFTQKDIQLPHSFSDKSLERVPIVGISGQVILLEGEKVMFTDNVQEKNYPDAKLPELAKMLKTTREQFVRDNPMPNDKEAGDRWLEDSKQIIIQADQRVPFEVIRLTMTTAAFEGYSSINFAVVPKGAASVD